MTNSDNRLTGRLMFGNDPVLQAAWLYYQSGLSQTEVADAMGISRVTVVKYLQTARKRCGAYQPGYGALQPHRYGVVTEKSSI